MANTQHTPGPWEIEGQFDDELGVEIVNRGEERYICEVAPFTEEWTDEEIANAHLIAAAPDLLEACKAAKKYLEPDLVEPGRTVFWALVAAITKAEGREG